MRGSRALFAPHSKDSLFTPAVSAHASSCTLDPLHALWAQTSRHAPRGSDRHSHACALANLIIISSRMNTLNKMIVYVFVSNLQFRRTRRTSTSRRPPWTARPTTVPACQRLVQSQQHHHRAPSPPHAAVLAYSSLIDKGGSSTSGKPRQGTVFDRVGGPAKYWIADGALVWHSMHATSAAWLHGLFNYGCPLVRRHCGLITSNDQL